MPTISTVANEMAKSFICADDKKYALNKIIYDLNYLVYSNNKQPLNYKSRAAMFTYIFNVIAGREQLQLKPGETLTADFSDIVLFFERRDFILKHLRAGIKKQCELN